MITSKAITLLAATALLAACGPLEQKEEPPLRLSNVDYATNGVVRLVGRFDQVDLNKDPRVICEKRAPTGSNIPKIFCMTQQERADMKVADRRTLEQFIDEYERTEFRRQNIQ